MKRLYKRSFLNRDEGLAAVTVMLQKVKETEYSGTIEISDCNRTVRLDMDYWTPKMKRDKLFKLDKLIKYLVDYRAAVAVTELQKY